MVLFCDLAQPEGERELETELRIENGWFVNGVQNFGPTVSQYHKTINTIYDRCSESEELAQ